MSVHDETFNYDKAISIVKDKNKMTKTYTELEVKEIYAQLIEQMGHDAGAVCNWSGYDTVSLDDWKKAWWEAFNDHCKYERECGIYNERKRITEDLLFRMNETND